MKGGSGGGGCRGSGGVEVVMGVGPLVGAALAVRCRGICEVEVVMGRARGSGRVEVVMGRARGSGVGRGGGDG